MGKQLIIIGASGHGKVAADIASKSGYDRIVFLDGDESKKECGKYPVVGKENLVSQLDGDVFVAIGNPEIRKRMMEGIEDDRIATLIHPDAVIAEDVRIGTGTVVMAGVVINPGTSVGKGCIVNTCSSVDHDCRISDYVHVSVGSHLAGTVNVGEKTWIGAGAVISNNIDIAGSCMIGAGAIVVQNIPESGTYVGIPARKIK